MKHRGEILEKIVRQSHIPISEIARKIGYNRKSIYDFFHNPELPLDTILKIGKVIRHDFSYDFPELFPFVRNQVHENQEIYETKLLNECVKEKNEWMHKYIDLLEQHNALLSGALKDYLKK
jgi:hypothetical protein